MLFDAAKAEGAQVSGLIARDMAQWTVRDVVLRVMTPSDWDNHGVRMVSGPFNTLALWGLGELTGVGAQDEVGADYSSMRFMRA